MRHLVILGIRMQNNKTAPQHYSYAQSVDTLKLQPLELPSTTATFVILPN